MEPGQWKLLWMHPSLPYLEAGGAYAEVEDLTKTLIFSSWTVVPEPEGLTRHIEAFLEAAEGALMSSDTQFYAPAPQDVVFPPPMLGVEEAAG